MLNGRWPGRPSASTSSQLTGFKLELLVEVVDAVDPVPRREEAYKQRLAENPCRRGDADRIDQYRQSCTPCGEVVPCKTIEPLNQIKKRESQENGGEVCRRHGESCDTAATDL